MEKYKVTVNGKVYDVVVEKVDSNYVPEAAAAPAPAAPAPAAPSAGASVMNSPIQGTVLKVLVKPGQAVKRGEPVVVVEAMKLENDIVAEHDSVIDEIFVTERQVVDNGTPLVSLRG